MFLQRRRIIAWLTSGGADRTVPPDLRKVKREAVMIRHLKRFATIVAAVAVTATPALAAGKPAASLSVAKSARAATPAGRGSRIAAGPTATLVNIGILAALAGVVLLATTGGDDDSDSN
jgi:hypothetical protein